MAHVRMLRRAAVLSRRAAVQGAETNAWMAAEAPSLRAAAGERWWMVRVAGSVPQRGIWWSSGDRKGGRDGKEGKDEGGKRGKSEEKTRDSDASGRNAEAAPEGAKEGGGNGASEMVSDGDGAVTRSGVGENAPLVQQVLALPVKRPCLPWFLTQIYTSDAKLIEALAELRRSPLPYAGLFLEKDTGRIPDAGSVTTVPRAADLLHEVGTLASLQTLQATPDGGVVAWFLAHRRVRRGDVLQDTLPPVVRAHHIFQNKAELQDNMVKALSNEIVSAIRAVVRINPMYKEQMQYITTRVEVHDAFRLADFAAATTSADAEDVQRVLEAQTLQERLHDALKLLRREEELSKLQQKIASQVDEKMKDQQRKYFLHEQLKSIKKELGLEKDDKDTLLQNFRDRAAALDMPQHARTVFEEELDKLSVLERNSSEFNITRSYLDWITCIPWGKYSTDNFDITRARTVLDDQHYGMKDVKERILEFIAVGKLRGSVQGKIICLVGPPGVGKTSIGRSIAAALNREFFRFSVGGLSDVAEIKGHRRTYVGAMPGKLIQCFKSTKVSNPLILIDEIDKIAQAGWRGDPTSALLELLDPSQNTSFVDHYLDIPVDASKVLFICTANVLDTIPGPLRDRMEIIDLSGYDAPEKVEIVRRHLEPKVRKEAGLEPGANVPPSLGLADSAIDALIKSYCRESGVRSLEKHLEKIFRKVALKLVREREEAIAARKARGEDVTLLERSHNAFLESRAKAAAAAAAAVAAASAAKASASPFSASVAVPTAPPPPTSTPAAPAAPTAPTALTAPAAEGSRPSEHAHTGEAIAEADLAPPPLPEVDDKDWRITAEVLPDYVGKAKFTSDRLYTEPPPGVVMGLAYTAMGGAALYIEVTSTVPRALLDLDSGARPAGEDESDGGVARGGGGGGGGAGAGEGKRKGATRVGGTGGGGLMATGQLGGVMEESTRIAHTFSRRFLQEVQPGNNFLERATVHLHVPEGATPKDGPSAGCTMVTAFLSLGLNRKALPDLAMTGEISLMGKVLPVGGIREKVMAARRSGVKTIVVPRGNEKDVAELPEHLKDGLTIHFASEYSDVFRVAFPDVPLPTTTP